MLPVMATIVAAVEKGRKKFGIFSYYMRQSVFSFYFFVKDFD